MPDFGSTFLSLVVGCQIGELRMLEPEGSWAVAAMVDVVGVDKRSIIWRMGGFENGGIPSKRRF